MLGGEPQSALRLDPAEAQRTANTYSMRSEVPPFVMLLEGFCERMLSDTPRWQLLGARVMGAIVH
ncbi:unnamed protein product [Effrenium voratum]|uniref:Uncharacterized protein n=1 Tax=Effrenium voratum TaxID=2562239 RepID=A0AA36HUD9_9DINO|nr:unnamed protein product [Effrenium voratum]